MIDTKQEALNNLKAAFDNPAFQEHFLLGDFNYTPNTDSDTPVHYANGMHTEGYVDEEVRAFLYAAVSAVLVIQSDTTKNSFVEAFKRFARKIGIWS